MRPTSSIPPPAARAARRLLPALVLLLLAGALPALGAPPVKVTSAVPDTGEQGTLSLVVRVAGDNFGTDSQVAFYVTGTTNPGGITVRNVHWVNAKALDATLDIDAAAQTELKFDIQVRTGGRTGKGTELFKVLEKPTGTDTTPPSDAIELTATEIEFNTALLTWINPADDGLDPTSGPAVGFAFRIRDDGPWTTQLWDTDPDPLHLGWGYSPCGAPGEAVASQQIKLVPETTYWAAVRYYDDRDNWSALSASSEVQFTTAPFLPGDWVAETVDAPSQAGDCYDGNEDLEFDGGGEPAVFLTRTCGAPPDGTTTRYLARRTAGAWALEELPAHVGAGDDLAFDPTGRATIASSNWANYDRKVAGQLQLYSQLGAAWSAESIDAGVPMGKEIALAYRGDTPIVAYPVTVRNSSLIRLAERNGGVWAKHEFAVSSVRWIRLALDPAGNAMIVYRESLDESFRFAIWDGSTWLRGTIDPRQTPDEICGRRSSLVWNPLLGGFSAAHYCADSVGGEARTRICHESSTSPATWQCATVGDGLSEPSLALALGGTMYLAYVVNYAPFLASSVDAGLTWSEAEFVDWSTDNWTMLRIDPSTDQPTLTYFAAAHPQPALLFAHRP